MKQETLVYLQSRVLFFGVAGILSQDGSTENGEGPRFLPS